MRSVSKHLAPRATMATSQLLQLVKQPEVLSMGACEGLTQRAATGAPLIARVTCRVFAQARALLPRGRKGIRLGHWKCPPISTTQNDLPGRLITTATQVLGRPDSALSAKLQDWRSSRTHARACCQGIWRAQRRCCCGAGKDLLTPPPTPTPLHD